ncbi:MAG TPA: hypothetical protein VGH02_10295 [Rhizomicrobium sp.]|jgi:hypothetical protein
MEFFEKLPWWVKWAATAGFGLVSMFAGIVAQRWQVVGFLFGISFLLISTIAACWHFILNKHNPSPTRIGSSLSPDSVSAISTSLVIPKADADLANNDPSKFFVRESVTPSYLCDLYEGKTSIQASKLAAPFVGKWLRVSGPLQNVTEPTTDGQFFVSLKQKSISDPLIFLQFGSEWLEKLTIIPRGDIITAIGQISAVTRFDISLKNSELSTNS